MAIIIPYTVPPWIERQFLDLDGVPLASGKVYSYIAGTSTPKATYADSDSVTPTANANPLVLDANGRGVFYLASGGYKFIVADADDVPLYTVEDVEDVGATFLGTMGVILATGSTNVTSGYTVLSTDQFVSVASTGGANPCIINLPAVSSRGLPVVIKNLGTVALEIRRAGSDTIDGLTTRTVSASSSPTFHTVVLLPDGVSAWYVMASY